MASSVFVRADVRRSATGLQVEARRDLWQQYARVESRCGEGRQVQVAIKETPSGTVPGGTRTLMPLMTGYGIEQATSTENRGKERIGIGQTLDLPPHGRAAASEERQVRTTGRAWLWWFLSPACCRSARPAAMSASPSPSAAATPR